MNYYRKMLVFVVISFVLMLIPAKLLSCGPSNYPPVASLSVEPIYAVTGQPVIFDGNDSYDPDHG